MTGLVVKLTLDVIVAALLAVTIMYCWQLNRRIRVLQDSKNELAQLIKHFDESTEKASASIIALQTASKKIGETMQTRIEKANFLADDLAFMIEKGSKLADQMENGIHSSRKRQEVPPPPPEPAAQLSPRGTAGPMQAQRSAQPVQAQPNTAGGANARAKSVSSLESVLQRVSNRNANAAEAQEQPASSAARTASALKIMNGGPTARLRSKAEQELLEALKSGS